MNKIGKAELHNIDCMAYMATLPDKTFDLAIVDPPYGFENKILRLEKKINKGNKFALLYKNKKWNNERPSKEYFIELQRVSKNQLICGGNYFADLLPVSRGWAMWDKEGDNLTVVNNELIWTSFDKSIKMFRRCHGLDKGFMNKEGANIHPTQKPVKLYEWLLTNYAEQGQRILDTHLGSGSIAIACNNLDFDLVGCELDEDYYKAACDRINQANAQTRMF
jgi:site-specific DNA-methyltransferase (adenine-specific)